MTRKLHDTIVQLTEHPDYRFTLRQLRHGKTVPEIRSALIERGYTFKDANHVIDDVQMTLQLEDTYGERMEWLFAVVAFVLIAVVLLLSIYLPTIIG